MLTPESQFDNHGIDFMATTHCFYICAYSFELVTVNVTLTLDGPRKSRNSTQPNTPLRLLSLPCYL